MKTISIRQLHTHTGRFVREAQHEAIRVTDRGREVAVLEAPAPGGSRGQTISRASPRVSPGGAGGFFRLHFTRSRSAVIYFDSTYHSR